MMKRNILKIFFLASLLVFLGSSGMLIHDYLEYQKGDTEYESLKVQAVRRDAPADDILTDGAPEDSTSEDGALESHPDEEISQKTYEPLNIDFAALRKINSDIIAWLDIPGTEISYPVAQGSDNSYYLNHTFKGTVNLAGCIFMDFRNTDPAPDTNTVLYGHNMKNGSMFGTLRKFRERSFWETHPDFYLYLVDGTTYRCTITAGFDTGAEIASLPVSFRDEERDAYLSGVSGRRWYDTGIVPEEDSPLITLITCHSSGRADLRVAVQGKMIRLEKDEDVENRVGDGD